MYKDKFVVMGGRRLKGTVRVSGAKNAVLPIMAACILGQKEIIIHDVPDISDVREMEKMLQTLGAKLTREGNVLIIDPSNIQPQEISENLVRKIRASSLVMGPMLGKFGWIKVAYPGGCNIGSRPVDFHLKGFQQLHAVVEEKHGFIEAGGANLQGETIYLDFPSVGATENLMMAACLIPGITRIRNAAREPEIVDLQNFLNGMGANIKGAGTDTIKVTGVKNLGSVEHKLIPDRIEAGTHMIAVALTCGDVLIENVIAEHLVPLISKLKEIGCEIIELDNRIRVIGKPVKGTDIRTLPYPGFPTDLQPQMMVLLCVADGTSIVVENIFENRFKHASELRRLGADIKIEGRIAVVKGVKRLTGAFVEATDLRAASSLVLAGLVSEEATVVENIHHLDRGYEGFEKKYNELGARIIRISNSLSS
ncbi:MAG: UDP-N-acetylglucosamine 1-carboxyvinyltransferase [Bacillota bacterium]